MWNSRTVFFSSLLSKAFYLQKIEHSRKKSMEKTIKTHHSFQHLFNHFSSLLWFFRTSWWFLWPFCWRASGRIGRWVQRSALCVYQASWKKACQWVPPPHPPWPSMLLVNWFFLFLFLEVLQTHGGFTPRSTPLLHSFLFRAFRLRRCGVWFVRSSFSGLCHWWLGEDAGGLLPTAKFRWCQESHRFLLLLRGFCAKLTWEWLLGNGTCCHYSRIPFRDLEGEFDWCIYWSGDHVPAGWQQIIDLESPLGQDSWVSANNGCRVYIFVYLWFQYPYWSIKLARSF